MSEDDPVETERECRICKESTDELGKCGACQLTEVCPECWMTSRCCVQLEASE